MVCFLFSFGSLLKYHLLRDTFSFLAIICCPDSSRPGHTPVLAFLHSTYHHLKLFWFIDFTIYCLFTLHWMVNSLSPGTLSCSAAYPQSLEYSRCSLNACWMNKQVNLTSANSLQISTPDLEGNWVWLCGGWVQSHPRANTDLRTTAAAAVLSPSFPWRSPPAVSCYLILGSALAPVCSDCLVTYFFHWLGAPWREGLWASFLESHSLICGSAQGIIAVCLSTWYHFLRKHVYLSSHMGSQGEHAPEGEQGLWTALVNHPGGLKYKCLDSIHKDSDLLGREWDSNMGCFIKFSRWFFFSKPLLSPHCMQALYMHSL